MYTEWFKHPLPLTISSKMIGRTESNFNMNIENSANFDTSFTIFYTPYNGLRRHFFEKYDDFDFLKMAHSLTLCIVEMGVKTEHTYCDRARHKV